MVVDAARFGLGEGVVGFGDLDEFFGGGFIATRKIEGVSRLILHAEWRSFDCGSGAGRLRHGVGASSRILIGVILLAEEAVSFLDLSV